MDKCNPKAPDLNQQTEILIELLSIERERLKTAVKIEKERNIVFPETTIIIRDIQKLTEAVYGGEEAQAEQKKLLPSEIMRKRHER